MNEIRTAWVLGLGESGEGAAELLRRDSVSVVGLDAGSAPAVLEAAARLEALGVDARPGATGLPEGVADVCVVSPGIPADAPWLLACQARGVPILSELELAWQRRTARVLAVTGSNGKTTLVRLLEQVLRRAGLRAAAAGNIGPCLSRVVGQPLDWLVVEVSSFQLEWVRKFRADVGILLNLLPNHLDRHGTMERYAACKARLFARAETHDLCLVEATLKAAMRERSGGAGHWLGFGAGPDADIGYRDGWIEAGGRMAADVRGTLFDNAVTGPAAAAAWAAARACGVDNEVFEQAVRDFQPLPHRMQSAGCVDGVRYINDSKATNLAALAAAVQRCERGVHLIAGGLAKETHFHGVKDLLVDRVAGVYLIGRASKAMSDAWSSVLVCQECGSLESAFSRASALARPGETVLLSPGCASFDQFSGYEARGARFLELVGQQRSRVKRVTHETEAQR